MATRERHIVDAIIRALSSAELSGASVVEERGSTLPVEELPAVDVSVAAITTDLMGLPRATSQVMHRMSIELSVMAAELHGEPPSKVADRLVAAVHRTVSTSAEVRALVWNIRPTFTRVDRQPSGDGMLMRRSMTYEIEFPTAYADLELISPA